MAIQAPIALRGKLVWIGLILFIAVWMFVLGIMVGRGTAPMPQVNRSIEKKLAQLKSDPSEQGQTKPNSPPEQDQNIPMTELKFYEKLKETEAINRPIQVPAKPSTATTSDKKPTKSGSEKALPMKATPQEPAPITKKIELIPGQDTRPQAPPPAVERFTIQVAAVKSSQNAEKLVLDLRQKGFDAYQIRSQSPNGETWYRVRVGAFQHRSEAQSTLARLSKIQINGMVLQTP